MADKTGIEWTDATWNIITGCTLVDEGCRHCYAAHLITSWPAIGNHPSRKGLARKNAAGESKFTGEVRFNAQWLDQPLRWKKPRRIFVCAHGDLFHEAVPDEWIDKVFAVMALCPQHTFQVLTKRPDRMRKYINGDGLALDAADRCANIACIAQDGFAHHLNGSTVFEAIGDDEEPTACLTTWPLPNVWLGTSVSDQASADARIPDLLATPAAVRFLSAEPLLGPLYLSGTSEDGRTMWNWLTGDVGTMYPDGPDFDHTGKIDWVIVGGESGPKARPMHPEWARSLRDQCAAAGVAFFFKQWGEWAPLETTADRTGQITRTTPCAQWHDACGIIYDTLAKPDPLTFFSEGAVYRVGKARAGRLLDGREHNAMPGVR